MFFSIIWKALTGNLGGIVKAITDYLGKASDNETARVTSAIAADKETAIAAMQTSATIYHDRVDLFKGMKVTQYLLAAALIPPLAHQGSIYLDSTPFPYLWLDGFWPTIKTHLMGTWHVVPAPKPYDEREWQMIASLLGIQTALTAGTSILKTILRK